MKISIVGTGYVGLVTGACLSEAGIMVQCIDTDITKIRMLKKFKVPFYEPKLSDILVKTSKKKYLTFTSSYKTGISNDTQAVFMCVGTPPKRNGYPNINFLKSALRSVAQNYKGSDSLVIFIKSTVPVGTNKFAQEYLNSITKDSSKFIIASNPEFLKEGHSIDDFKNPDRIIIGTKNPHVKKISKEIYRNFSNKGRLIKFTSIESAEIIKYASNTFLATKISFMNELGKLSDKVGANIDEIKSGIGADPRIGNRFLDSGLGYGGSCLPKDLDGLIYSFKSNGIKPYIFPAVKAVNQHQVQFFLDKINNNLDKKKSALLFWGVTFKPGTDDIRESQCIKLISKLLDNGHRVYIYDPKGLENFKNTNINYKNIKFLKSKYQSIDLCDALIIGTEWNEFKSPNTSKLKKLKQRIVFDGRNCINSNELSKSGIKYIRIFS